CWTRPSSRARPASANGSGSSTRSAPGRSTCWSSPRSRTSPSTFRRRPSPSRSPARSGPARRRRSASGVCCAPRRPATAPASTPSSPATRSTRTTPPTASASWPNRATPTASSTLTRSSRARRYDPARAPDGTPRAPRVPGGLEMRSLRHVSLGTVRGRVPQRGPYKPSRHSASPRREEVPSMACRISEFVLECRDPEALARFWCEVLDFVVLEREEDGGTVEAIEIGPREGFGGPQPTIVLSRNDDPKTHQLRLHFDVNATDRDQSAELERLLAIGARHADVGQTGQEPWHVLADPEGNEFCL